MAKMPPAAVARPTTSSGLCIETSIAPTGSNEMLIGCQCAPPPNQNALSAARRRYPSRPVVAVASAAVVATSLQAIDVICRHSTSASYPCGNVLS